MSYQGSPERADGSSMFLVGELVDDRFRIVRLLARGGMGEVYEAFDETLDKPIALKTLRQRITGDPASRDRFKREVLIAHRVTHPSVCRTFDAGFADGVPYFTMELLRGETLAERLARIGRMTPADALPIIEQVATGLSAAHQVGIVHRDFKSANVMLVETSAGGSRAVVSDFGIARVQGDAAMNSTTGLLGSPAYMAPEQVEGRAVGPAADIYALGVVLYEMVTGELPFVGATPIVTAMKRLTESPRPPRAVAADLPPHWDAVILRCLERDPSRRFGDVLDVTRALAEPGLHARRPAARWSRRRSATAAAAAVVLAALIGVRVARRDPGERPRVALPADPQAAQQYVEAAAQARRWECVRARDLLQQVVLREPTFAMAHGRLALAYNCLGRDRDASRAATAALELPTALSAADHAWLEAAYWRAVGSVDRAVPIYARLFADHPDSVEYGQDLLFAQLAAESWAGARDTLARLQRAGFGGDVTTLMLETELLARTTTDPRDAILKASQTAAVARAAGASAIAADLLTRQIIALIGLGQLTRALEVAEEARGLMIQIGDRDGVGAIVAQQSAALRQLGRIGDAEARAREARALADETGSSFRQRRAQLALALAAWSRGELESARVSLVLVTQNDQLARNPRDAAYDLCMQAQLRVAQGLASDARGLRAQAIAAAGAGDFATRDPGIAELDGQLAFVADDLAAARRSFEARLAAHEQAANRPQVAATHAALAELELAAGDPTAARSHALIALDHFAHAGQADEAALAQVVIALTALSAGTTAAAEATLAPATARGQLTERPRVSALIALAGVRVQVASGDPTRIRAARRSAERVVAETERRGMAEALDARLLLGELELAGGSRGRLEALVQDAASRGMTRIAHRAAAALARR